LIYLCSAPSRKLISFLLWIQYPEANNVLQLQTSKRSPELSAYWSVTINRVKIKLHMLL